MADLTVMIFWSITWGLPIQFNRLCFREDLEKMPFWVDILVILSAAACTVWGVFPQKTYVLFFLFLVLVPLLVNYRFVCATGAGGETSEEQSDDANSKNPTSCTNNASSSNNSKNIEKDKNAEVSTTSGVAQQAGKTKNGKAKQGNIIKRGGHGRNRIPVKTFLAHQLQVGAGLVFGGSLLLIVSGIFFSEFQGHKGRIHK